MQIRHRVSVWMFCCALSTAPSASAETQTLTLDPVATKIEFVLGATLHSADGTIRLERGAIEFDPDVGAASGEIVIDATSAETGLASRDHNMHADVLESARFPTMTFRANHLEVARRDATSADVTLHGVLSMHGQEHPLALPAKLVAHDGRVSIEIAFDLPYVDWGVPDYSNLVLRVDRFVQVKVHGEGVLGRP
jgi:polyisoprenoid-binding protein YceI